MRPPLLSLFLAPLVACAPLEKPPTRETVELRGNAYDRGFQYGTKLKSKIHSFYATLLTNSLFPYLSREQPDIATLIPKYAGEEYGGGKFAYQLLLDSAKSIEKSLPLALRDEMRGVADGSGMTYEEILILNTFVDTTLAVRGIALAIRLSRAPVLKSVTFTGAETDGADNDGDGDIDEAGEGTFDPYVPELFAHAVELPVTTTIQLVLTDVDGVDPATVRLFLNNELFNATNPAVSTTVLNDTDLLVTLTPPAPLAAASRMTLVVGAGDKKIITVPLPQHASFMRDEEITLTTAGAGLTRAQVLRPELTDGRTRAPPIAFGVRGPLTDNGGLYIGQHFSLLDANTAYKHTVALRHFPENGPSFVTIGWAGIVWGFAGLSSNGVGYACNPADTLDNSVVGSVLAHIDDLSQAELKASGIPIGFVGRKILERATDVATAQQQVHESPRVFGWTCVLGDATGALEGNETDSDVLGDPGDGYLQLTAGGLNSTNADNLVVGSNFLNNVPDSPTLTLAGQRILPERGWSGFFNRGRRATDGIKEKLDAAGAPITPEFIQELLGQPRFVDGSDSMNAVVLDFQKLQVRSAMGAMPATSMPFEVTEVR